MTKIDIFSGFLGAGKTTLIKKLLQEAFSGEQVVLIENEFGEIGIDGGFLKEAGIEIREMNSGCICCSLVGDFGTALREVISTYHPDRILIEPSGVGKLSDVVKAVEQVTGEPDVELNSTVTVVDASKCKMYMRNFGEFFNNQIQYAGTIVLSRTDKEEKYDGYYAVATNLEDCAKDILDINSKRYKIEDCFRVLKANFQARPVHHRTPSRITAHFMICYTALLIYRLLENKLDEYGTHFTTDNIRDTLKNMNVVNTQDMFYTAAYTSSKVCTALNGIFDLGLDKKYYQPKELNKKIKKISG